MLINRQIAMVCVACTLTSVNEMRHKQRRFARVCLQRYHGQCNGYGWMWNSMRKKKNEMKCSERAWTQRMLEKLYRRERHQITDKYVVEKKLRRGMHLPRLLAFAFVSAVCLFRLCATRWMAARMCLACFGRLLFVAECVRSHFQFVFFFLANFFLLPLASPLFWHKMLLKSPRRKYLERMKCFMPTNFSSLGVCVCVCIFRSREPVVCLCTPYVVVVVTQRK